MPAVLLAIDIGNTHTKLSLYDDRQQLAGWRLATNGERTADEFAVTLAALMRSRGLGRPGSPPWPSARWCRRPWCRW